MRDDAYGPVIEPVTERELAADRSLDSTLALLREGYEFISNRCRRMHTDAFRLLGRRAVCEKQNLLHEVAKRPA